MEKRGWMGVHSLLGFRLKTGGKWDASRCQTDSLISHSTKHSVRAQRGVGILILVPTPPVERWYGFSSEIFLSLNAGGSDRLVVVNKKQAQTVVPTSTALIH